MALLSRLRPPKVRKLQERALRAVYYNKSATYKELLRWVDLHTLQNRRLQEMATVMYKIKNNVWPAYIADLFKLNNSSGYHLRNSDFIIPRFNSVTYGKHSLCYLGPVIWAKLDSYIKLLSDTLSIFKKTIGHVNICSLIGQDSGCNNCFLCQN